MKALKRTGSKRLIIVLLILSVSGLLPKPCFVSARDVDYADNSICIQASDESGGTAGLMIDNINCYENMEKTYSEGYVPKVEGDTVYLIVPIVSSRKLKDDSLQVSLDLGDVKSMPFVCKNYVRTVSLREVKVNEGNEMVECYLVSFALELKQARYNGSYPVIVTAKGNDESGKAVEQDFTFYVTITDGIVSDDSKNGGKNPGDTGSSGTGVSGSGSSNNGLADAGNAAGPSAGDNAANDPAGQQPGSSSESPQFAPKLIVQEVRFSEQSICAGDSFQVDITLLNTSKTEKIRNMTVTVSGQGEYFSLMSQSDTIYVDSVPAGQTLQISYEYRVNASAPQGQYILELAMDYMDSKGTSYAAAGKVQVPVEQKMNMQFDPVSISPEVQVADVTEVSVQAMNLSREKVCNVRAVLEADGLMPKGTIFIGDVEAGALSSGSTEVTVTSLSEGESPYGKTEGIVTFYYEDEAGKEYQETASFTTTIISPFSEEEQGTKDETGQWWVVMAVVLIVLCIFFIYVAARRIRRRKQQDEMVA